MRVSSFLSAFGKPAAAVLVLVTWMVGGCGKEKQARTEPSEPAAARTSRDAGPAKASAVADVPSGDADLLQNVAVGAAATNKTLLEGDRAWQELLAAMRPPPTPAEWETNPPTKEAIAAFQKKNGALALKVADLAKDFYTKYPKHEMAGEARDREQYLLGVAIEVGETNVQARLVALEETRLKDPSLSEEDRIQLRVNQLQRTVNAQEGASSTARLAVFEKGARALIKEFPQRAELNGLLLSVAQGYADSGDLTSARGLANDLAKAEVSQELKSDAEALIKKFDRVGKPLALKFKAVDGREVNLESLKGKVVLIDFWATWCGPCMAELPTVKGTHAKLNPKGFEIIGISLDHEKGALQKVLTERSMTWPQYFEEGDSNKFADEFEVASIPTMWLVDKKGNLRDLNGRENLAEKVEKLLAE
jgi:thiol-disulfide isomerase/thioredoxin